MVQRSLNILNSPEAKANLAEKIREFDERLKLDREKLRLDKKKHEDDVILKRKALNKKPTTNTK